MYLINWSYIHEVKLRVPDIVEDWLPEQGDTDQQLEGIRKINLHDEPSEGIEKPKGIRFGKRGRTADKTKVMETFCMSSPANRKITANAAIQVR